MVHVQTEQQPIMTQAKNILGESLKPCSTDPMTGYLRDGCCNTNPQDLGAHTVCVVLTEDFLAFTKAAGNDLSSPRPEFGFPGLNPGDSWCLCAERWKEALAHGAAPKVRLESTHEATLSFVGMEDLLSHAHDGPDLRGRHRAHGERTT